MKFKIFAFSGFIKDLNTFLVMLFYIFLIHFLYYFVCLFVYLLFCPHLKFLSFMYLFHLLFYFTMLLHIFLIIHLQFNSPYISQKTLCHPLSQHTSETFSWSQKLGNFLFIIQVNSNTKFIVITICFSHSLILPRISISCTDYKIWDGILSMI